MRIYIGISKDEMSFGVMPLVREYDMVIEGNWDGIDFTFKSSIIEDSGLVDKRQIEKELSKLTAYELEGDCIKEVNEPNQKLFYFGCKFDEMRNCNLLGMENCEVGIMRNCVVLAVSSSEIRNIQTCRIGLVDKSRVKQITGHSLVERINFAIIKRITHSAIVRAVEDSFIEVVDGEASIESVLRSIIGTLNNRVDTIENGRIEYFESGHINVCKNSEIESVHRGTINKIHDSKVCYCIKRTEIV